MAHQASFGVTFPAATAASSDDEAVTVLAAVVIGGSGNAIGETVRLGYVDQSRGHLDPKHNVWEEVSGGHDYMTVNKQEMSTRAYVGAFNFKGEDQQKKVGQLSGGERNRVHIAKMLKTGGNVLLLDEPTNDLDVETLRALSSARCPRFAIVGIVDRIRAV